MTNKRAGMLLIAVFMLYSLSEWFVNWLVPYSPQ